jgi:hypothetical protein
LKLIEIDTERSRSQASLRADLFTKLQNDLAISWSRALFEKLKGILTIGYTAVMIGSFILQASNT